MTRHKFSFKEIDYPDLKEKLLGASPQYEYFQLLDSNNHDDAYSRFDWIAALGSIEEMLNDFPDHFQSLYNFHQHTKDWLFGHLNYNLKNVLEELQTSPPDNLQFPLMTFFVPETVIYKQEELITVESYRYSSPTDLIHSFLNYSFPVNPKLHLSACTERDEYLQKVNKLKAELQYGNIYEINYCIEFATNALISPPTAFKDLNGLSRSPFAAYYKCGDQYLMCASPERYLLKRGNTICSQPIKGTAKRGSDPEKDKLLKEGLINSQKERSENVMIVDLVRNDLSRTALKASVKVDELFGIYSYPGVHQMVSTISSEVNPATTFTDILRYSFPMGSMTGAPKISAMNLIDQTENFSRSLYSGSVGYITPEGDFDFNVVIRSLFYNGKTLYLSARVGSAITIYCDAASEYEECLLKVANLFRVFS